MNRSIVLVAIVLSAGCASTPNSETDQLAADIVNQSQEPECGGDTVPYCQSTSASRLDTNKAFKRCGCMSNSVLR